MKVLQKKCIRTLVGPGTYAYDAEMVMGEDNEVMAFLHANYNNGSLFTVGNGSIFDFMTGKSSALEPDVEFSESYKSLLDAEKSAYYQYFAEMDQMVGNMIKENQRLLDSMRKSSN